MHTHTHTPDLDAIDALPFEAGLACVDLEQLKLLVLVCAEVAVHAQLCNEIADVGQCKRCGEL